MQDTVGPQRVSWCRFFGVLASGMRGAGMEAIKGITSQAAKLLEINKRTGA